MLSANVRIRTILGFLLRKARIRALRNSPRIAHANLGSEDLLRKPRIHTQSSRIAQPNLGHPQILLRIIIIITIYLLIIIVASRAGVRARLRDRSCFFAADGRAASRVRSFVGSLPQKVELLCAHDRCGFVSADGRAASLARSIVGLLPRMAEVWLRDPT